MADPEPSVEPENTEETLKDEEEDVSVQNTEELTEDAQALKEELAKIVVHPPVVEPYVYCNVFSRCKLSSKYCLLSERQAITQAVYILYKWHNMEH